MIYYDRIFRHRTDLLRPEYTANGKYKLGGVMLGDRCGDGTKYIRVTILNCSHRCINDRFSGQSIPRKTELWPTFCIMEWTGVLELVWPVRAFKVKVARTLRDPGKIRK